MPAARATAVPQPYADRLSRVREQMKRRKLDAYLVFDRMDQIWLTGFTGEDGGVLVTARQIILLTDGRFDEAADIEAPYAKKVVRKKRGPETIAAEVKRVKAQRVGFDPDHLHVSTFGGLRKASRPATLVSTSGLIGEMRRSKDAGEVAKIRAAIRVAETAFKQLLQWMKPGMTEREVAARLVYEMQCLGAQGPSFAPIVAVGANASLPHYEPGNSVVTDGDPVLIDWGARCDWYASDLTRVVQPSSIPPRLAEIHRIVREAHDRAIAVIKPGIQASAVDRAAREHIRKSGYGKQFSHGLGHGIGLNVHEAPGLRMTGEDVLTAGMVVTIEPGIYLPGVGGVRIEDDVLVTETGHEVLSTLPTDVP